MSDDVDILVSKEEVDLFAKAFREESCRRSAESMWQMSQQTGQFHQYPVMYRPMLGSFANPIPESTTISKPKEIFVFRIFGWGITITYN